MKKVQKKSFQYGHYFLCAVVFLLFVCFFQSGHAEEAAIPPQRNQNVGAQAVTIPAVTDQEPVSLTSKQIMGEGKNTPELESIIAKAATEGSVRIIVKVKTENAFQPMADATTATAVAQMAQIASAQAAVFNELQGHTVSNSHNFQYTPFISMTVDSAALKVLMASPNVLQISEDTLSAPTLDLSIPRIGAPSLHASNVRGSGMTIAVLDTGVDKLHPFLAGSVVSEACYSTNDAGDGSSTICPGGATASTAVNSAMPYGGTCPAGKCGHGTHVAGIAAGRQSVAGSPGPGVAPKAKVIAIQVFSLLDNDTECGTGNSPCVRTWASDQMKGLERVYALRSTYTIASVNMSIGGGQYSSACDKDTRKPIIDNLRAAGTATIISSMNNGYCGSIGAPACISSAISVGATNDADAVASYSNSASFMSLLAPGSAINSSIPGPAYASKDGTSMAAPHVAGAWALMRQQFPTKTVSEILTAFQSTGLSVTDGKCSSTTKKRINVLEAATDLDPIAFTTLTVNSSGAFGVVISASPTTYAGTTNYSKTHLSGTSVTLTAPATSGGKNFSNWSGCDSSTTMTCTLSMTANKTVTVYYATPVTYTLNVNSSGTTGVVISASPTTYAGTTNYSKTAIPSGTSITLTAPATSGGENFHNWTGCDSSSTTTCTVSMTADKTVTATYVPPSYTLNVNSSGTTGVAITASPEFYAGTTDYSKIKIISGVTVTLTAPATSGGKNFSNWSGCDSSSTVTCTLSMTANKTVTANYVTPTYILDVGSSGASGVDITASPTTYGGTTNYSKTAIPSGTSITLTAPATSGGKNFSNWTGCDSSSTVTCKLSVRADKTVTANYVTPTYILDVGSSGASGVDITASPTTYGGTTNYSKTAIPSGTSITLTAPATSGGKNFSNWTGCDSSSKRTCTLSMTANKAVTANYVTPTYTLNVNSSGASGVAITASPTTYAGTTNYNKTAIPSGTSITLTAPAALGGKNFSNWTGCDSSTTVTCTLSMTADKTVTANYKKFPWPLFLPSTTGGHN